RLRCDGGRARPRAPAQPGGTGLRMIAALELNADLLDDALARVAMSAGERDRAPLPPFPEEVIADLEAVGAMAWNAQPGTDRPPAAAELGLVRSVARADGSIGRILDGHLN